MLLINSKVALTLRWTKHCVLASASVENTDADSNNIIFTFKKKKKKKKLSKFLSKRLERSIYWNEHKTKKKNKNSANNYRYFLESNFLSANRLH